MLVHVFVVIFQCTLWPNRNDCESWHIALDLSVEIGGNKVALDLLLQNQNNATEAKNCKKSFFIVWVRQIATRTNRNDSIRCTITCCYCCQMKFIMWRRLKHRTKHTQTAIADKTTEFSSPRKWILFYWKKNLIVGRAIMLFMHGSHYDAAVRFVDSNHYFHLATLTHHDRLFWLCENCEYYCFVVWVWASYNQNILV